MSIAREDFNRLRACLCALAFALCVLAAHATPAWAHASLVASSPADNAMVEKAPSSLSLTFNEPVTPLVMRLFDDEGAVVTLPNPPGSTQTVVLDRLPTLTRGTHVLSWRVISADGHPVGGSLVFSIGAPSAGPAATSLAVSDHGVAGTLWLLKIAIYIGLFVGVGGAFFRAFLADPLRPATAPLMAACGVGLCADILSIGVQGADALGLPLASLASLATWQEGFATSYGATAIVAAAALAAGLIALATKRTVIARIATTFAVAGLAFALTLSGHASTAEPLALTRPAVFVHAVCVTFWIGSLVPLVALLRRADDAALTALQRFSRIIPLALGALIASGVALAVVQVVTPTEMLTTAYGNILIAKLTAVAVLLALAAVNRYALTPTVADPPRRRLLARMIVGEAAIVVVVLALVAGWRFTPPPRALLAVAAEPTFMHIHTGQAMADITLTPAHAGPIDLSIVLRTDDFGSLAAKAVSVTVDNAAVGLEPISRTATRDADGNWRVDNFPFPLAGLWTVRLDVLITDFDQATLEAPVEIK